MVILRSQNKITDWLFYTDDNHSSHKQTLHVDPMSIKCYPPLRQRQRVVFVGITS